jgi:hypothetical protein
MSTDSRNDRQIAGFGLSPELAQKVKADATRCNISL